VLDLGLQPLANALPESPEEFATEKAYPLRLAVCATCSLVQITDVIDPAVLFEHYLYVSGTSDTMAAHHRAYAADVVREYGLGADDLVVEVASNDGSLLLHFADNGTRTLGVEPARNIAEMARERGVETVVEFFGREVGERLRSERGPAACVVANNVVAHVEDTPDLLAGMAAIVGDEGVVVIEVPYVREMVERLEYDTIYHEHHCYFSVTALLRLFEGAGLSVARVDRVPVHGGSLRVHARPRGLVAEHAAPVLAVAAEEAELGLVGVERYRRFAEDVRSNKRDLLELLSDLRSQGRTLAAYGAPAKGNTLLNYCGIGPELVEYTVDKNPLKVGRYTPGMHLPILPAETLAERRPDDVLILAWNFAEEIRRQQAAYVEAGGRFLVPLPEPRIL
jgi:SAM-dependent methyltransferase